MRRELVGPMGMDPPRAQCAPRRDGMIGMGGDWGGRNACGRKASTPTPWQLNLNIIYGATSSYSYPGRNTVEQWYW